MDILKEFKEIVYLDCKDINDFGIGNFEKGKFYIAKDDKGAGGVYFLCPCGNPNHIVHLYIERKNGFNANMINVWELDIKQDGRISLSPSILTERNYETPKSRCHYFIKRNKIIWLNDSY